MRKKIAPSNTIGIQKSFDSPSWRMSDAGHDLDPVPVERPAVAATASGGPRRSRVGTMLGRSSGSSDRATRRAGDVGDGGGVAGAAAPALAAVLAVAGSRSSRRTAK